MVEVIRCNGGEWVGGVSLQGEMGWWNVDIDRKGGGSVGVIRENFLKVNNEPTNERTNAMHTRGDDERECGQKRKEKGKKEGRRGWKGEEKRGIRKISAF